MKNQISKYLFPSLLFMGVVLAVVLSAPLAYSQTASVRGTCKDIDGKPIANAEVDWDSLDTGRKFTLKTNAKGEYFSLGLTPGKYNLRLVRDGKEIFHISGVAVASGDNAPVDIDLKKEQANQAAGVGLTPEQLKAQQEQQAKAAKENNTVKALNEKLTDANASMTAGDYDKAVATLTEANAIDPSRDLVWFKLADAYRMSATKQTDPDEKKKRFASAVEDYQKAIDLRKASEQAAKDPNNNKTMAAYYNNLAEADSKSGKVDDAIAAYNQAATLAPDNAAQYYFNEGAVLTNVGKPDQANAAFDKVIAADPNKALAYYWKGINLIGKATLGKDNKMVAPDGTAEAFQKYLELDPNGPQADTAKQMLASIGATVETGFGTKKKTTPTKKQ